MSSFSKAFAAARKAKGPGKTFMWNGKSYSTNTKSDARAASTPRAASTAPTKSKRPPSVGARGAAKGKAAAERAAETTRAIRERMPRVEASTEGKPMRALSTQRPFMPQTRAALARLVEKKRGGREKGKSGY